MELIVRTSVIYFFLLVLVRATGRRELTEMSAFEFLVLVTMGDIVQQGITQEDMSITGAILAISTMAVWSVILGYVTYRWRKTESVISGIPVMIIRDGKLLEEALHIERVPQDEVKEAARSQGIDDLRKIKVGIIEPDGQFSFIKEQDAGSDQQGPKPRKKSE
jgi:uncharacterized membrane protein YcaP (DUF421 family)